MSRALPLAERRLAGPGEATLQNVAGGQVVVGWVARLEDPVAANGVGDGDTGEHNPDSCGDGLQTGRSGVIPNRLLAGSEGCTGAVAGTWDRHVTSMPAGAANRAASPPGVPQDRGDGFHQRPLSSLHQIISLPGAPEMPAATPVASAPERRLRDVRDRIGLAGRELDPVAIWVTRDCDEGAVSIEGVEYCVAEIGDNPAEFVEREPETGACARMAGQLGIQLDDRCTDGCGQVRRTGAVLLAAKAQAQVLVEAAADLEVADTDDDEGEVGSASR